MSKWDLLVSISLLLVSKSDLLVSISLFLSKSDFLVSSLRIGYKQVLPSLAGRARGSRSRTGPGATRGRGWQSRSWDAKEQRWAKVEGVHPTSRVCLVDAHFQAICRPSEVIRYRRGARGSPASEPFRPNPS